MSEEELDLSLEEQPSRLKIVAKIGFYLLLLTSFLYVLYDATWGSRKLEGGVQQKLVISGHEKLKKTEILELMGLQPGLQIRDYDLDEIEEKLKRHPRIKDVTLAKRTQDTLLLSVVERKAEYIVNTNNSLYEVDKDMNLISIGEVRDHSVFVISGDFEIREGNKIGSKFLAFSQSISKVFASKARLKERISEISLGSDGEITLYIFNPFRIKVLIGESLDKKKVRKLYASLAFFEKKNRRVKLLDLRGDDAVYH